MNKEKSCNFKCSTCENYCKEVDFCKSKGIKEVSKQVLTDFAQCDEYLIAEKFVMF